MCACTSPPLNSGECGETGSALQLTKPRGTSVSCLTISVAIPGFCGAPGAVHYPIRLIGSNPLSEDR
jgi:hypothetical protein